MKIKRRSLSSVISILTILSIVLSSSVFADEKPTFNVEPVVGARLVNTVTNEVIVIDAKDIGKKVRYIQPNNILMRANVPQDSISMQVEYDVAVKFDANNPNAAPTVRSGQSDTTDEWDSSYSVHAYATINYTIKIINDLYCIRVDSGSVRWEKDEASIRVLNKSILIGQMGKDEKTRRTVSNTLERAVSGMSASYATNFSSFLLADDAVYTASTWAICDIQRGTSNTWHFEVNSAANL